MNVEQFFSNKLRDLIDSSGLTRIEFSETIGVTEATVQRWLRGANSPSLGKIQHIADLFEVDPRELLGSRETISKEIDLKNTLIKLILEMDSVKDLELLKNQVEQMGRLHKIVKNRKHQ